MKKLFLLFTFLNVLVFLSLTILPILFATRKHQIHCTQDNARSSSSQREVSQRLVNNNIGPSGTLSILIRLRDAIGTAVQTWGFGPGRKHDIRHTRPSSPLPFVYRDTVSALADKECDHSDSGCELLTRGFGTVGVVRYSFSAERENIIGSSTQVQTACRCIGVDCDKAILMRPVNITERREDGKIYFTGKKSCVYQYYKENFTDCHAETLRMQTKVESDSIELPGYFVFAVDASQYNHGVWEAVGHRGWDYACLKEDFYSLPTVNLSLIMGNISSAIHEYPLSRHEGIPSQSDSLDCRPPPNVIYYRDMDEREGEECGAAFQLANAGASFLGSQMDKVAIGKNKRMYLRELPTVLVFWEIMILISAATLGLYFAISAFAKFKKKGEWTFVRIAQVLGVQLMSLIFEGLPLYFALSFESAASQWAGRFAYMGATIALGKDVLQPQTVAHGNILVLTAVVGESQFMSTQLVLVGLFSAVINLAAMVILGLVLVAFCVNRGKGDGEEAEMERWLKERRLKMDERLVRKAGADSSATLSWSSYDDLEDYAHV